MKQTLNEQVSRIKSMMGLNEDTENQYLDSALSKLDQGIHYNELPAKEKISLDIMVNDSERITPTEWYKQNGGTFGFMETKVRVKNADAQGQPSKRDAENAGEVGWLLPYIHYTQDTPPIPWVSMKTEEIDKSDFWRGSDMGYGYKELSVYLDNIEIIAVEDINPKFVEYEKEKANLTFDIVMARRKKEKEEENETNS
jgi:hypothetical protein